MAEKMGDNTHLFRERKPVAELTLAELEAELGERGIHELCVEREPGGMWAAMAFYSFAVEDRSPAYEAVHSETLTGAIGGAMRGRDDR